VQGDISEVCMRDHASSAELRESKPGDCELGHDARQIEPGEASVDLANQSPLSDRLRLQLRCPLRRSRCGGQHSTKRPLPLQPTCDQKN
jgi:hypothetical protein